MAAKAQFSRSGNVWLHLIPCFDGCHLRIAYFKYMGRQIYQPAEEEANNGNAA